MDKSEANHLNKLYKNPSIEEELLLCCARVNLDYEKEVKINTILSNKINWRYLLRKADQNKLKPLLYFHLRNKSGHVIPRDVMVDLEGYFIRNIKKNLFLWAELKKVLNKFEEHGIEVFSYKGPILSFIAFDNLALRDFNDLDIIVDSKNVPKIRKILSYLNYEPELKISNAIESKFVHYQKEYKFVNKRKKISIDLHLRFSELFLPNSTDWNFFNGKILKDIEINKTRIKIIPPEYMLLIICLHNYSHHWNSISLLVDLAEFIKCHKIKWQRIKEIAQNSGIQKIVLINFYLLIEILDFNIITFSNGAFSSCAFKNVIDMSLEIKNRIFSTEVNYKTRLSTIFLENIKFRDNLFLGMIDSFKDAFIPTNYELEKIRLPEYFFIFYFIMRPFSLLIRYQI